MRRYSMPMMNQWASASDPSTGNTYWYDVNNTSITTWTDPTKNWAETRDPASGKPYWYNTANSAEVTWERPEHYQPGGVPQQHIPEGYTASDMPPQPVPTPQPFHAAPPPQHQGMPYAPPPQGAPGTLGGIVQHPWVGDRFSCMEDFGSCIYGFFCAACMFGQTMERAGLMNCFGATVLVVMAYIVPWTIITLVMGPVNWFIADLVAGMSAGYFAMRMRAQLREKYHLVWEGDCTEFLWWWCCGLCTNCQQYRTVMRHVDPGTKAWIEENPGPNPYGGVPPAHPQAQAYGVQPIHPQAYGAQPIHAAPAYATATPAPMPSYAKA